MTVLKPGELEKIRELLEALAVWTRKLPMAQVALRMGVVILAASLAFLASCAWRSSQQIVKSWERPAECQQFLIRLDETVSEAGVRNGENFSIPGFPYLRANRFISALRDSIEDDAGREQWVRWMQELDLQGRKAEIQNLPEAAVRSLGFGPGGNPDRERLYSQARLCSAELLRSDQEKKDFYPALQTSVKIPDEYSTFLRVAGLYPLTAIPVYWLTLRYQKKIKSWYETKLEDLPVDGRLKVYVPEKKISRDRDQLLRQMEESRQNPLKVPLLEADPVKDLAWLLAPIIIQDEAASYDQIGQVTWKGECPEVDARNPTIYYYVSYAFLQEEPILQVNYVIWFPARAGPNPPAIELGLLDGLTIRLSLDPGGEIFMVDVMNNCGCYHLFAPDRERVGQTLSRPGRLDPFVPQWLPRIGSQERLAIRLNSGWHQVQRLLAGPEPIRAVPYQLVPYDVLETLAREGGRGSSIFDSHGIAKCSERVEPYLLFPMGIPRVGYMRQRGHHAIEFIGRAHFDDPDLFNQNFIFE